MAAKAAKLNLVPQLDLPFILYKRVSQVKGRSGASFISPEEQELSGRQIALAHGVSILEDHGDFADLDKSGGTLDRPELQRALQLIRDGVAGGIIGPKTDRLSRDTGDLLRLVPDVVEAGGRVLSDAGELDTSTPAGKLIVTALGMSGTFQRDQAIVELKKSVRNAVARGIHLGNPYGYDRGEGKVLVPNPVERKVVERIFHERADGLSWPRIASGLNADGLLPRPQNVRDPQTKEVVGTKQRQWSHQAVAVIVKSRVYLGEAFHGEERHPGAHEPLVRPELYEAANRTAGTKFQGERNSYLLSGLVRCASCGYAMRHASPDPDHRYYVCRGQKGAGKCAAPAMANADTLEELVWQAFEDRYAELAAVPARDEAEVARAEEEYEVAKDELRGAMRMKVELGANPSEVELELAEEQITRTRARLNLVEAERARVHRQHQVQLIGVGPDPRSAEGRNLPVEDRRHLLAGWIAAVVVRKAASYREPVTDRSTVLPVSEAPVVGLVDYIAAASW
jgi:DNA invertase Pin-like site-specific DNA recombinase